MKGPIFKALKTNRTLFGKRRSAAQPAVWLAAALLLAASAPALERYVTPNGDGDYSGTNWANACSNLQQAVDACGGVASTNYLKYGVYSNAAQIVVTNHPGLTIRGGYIGSGFDTTNAPTVLTRNTNYTIRIFLCTNSTLTFDNLTVSNGFSGAHGGGLYLSNCVATLTNCVIKKNYIPAYSHGGGICASNGTLSIFNSYILENYSFAGVQYHCGAGIYASGVSLTLKDCAISSNSASSTGTDGGNIWTYGGGLCLSGGSALLDGCSFIANSCGGVYQGIYGGGIYATGVNPLTITSCVFAGNYVASSASYGYPGRGGVMYLTGATAGQILDCQFLNNTNAANNGEDLYVGSSAALTLRNTTIGRGSYRGITKDSSGTLALTNCLVYRELSHGIYVATGAVTIANSTLAGNYGWGLTNAAGAVTIQESIVWDNYLGDCAGTNVTASYSCFQESRSGVNNMTNDPLFIAGYYLATNGLPFQTNTSPCIDAGSNTALALGLNTRTTRTDGSNDVNLVDLGYHSTNGVPSAIISNLALYVDIVNGDDANNGWSAGAGNAKQHISAALSNVLDGATINVAAGNYTTNAGESFPLTLQTFNLTLRGTNRDTTIVNAGGTQRGLTASFAGHLRLEGLTFSNGYSAVGGGLYLANCLTTITNCAIRKNRGLTTAAGVGIYASAGALSIFNSEIAENQFSTSGQNLYGGGIYALNVALILKACAISTNWVSTSGDGVWNYGGGLYLSGGNALLDECSFVSNSLPSGGNVGNGGGGIYATNTSPLTITNCVFAGNYAHGGAYSPSGAGGVMCLTGAGVTLITDCWLLNNDRTLSADDIFLNSSSPTLIRNTVIGKGGLGRAIYKPGSGALNLANCLICAQTNDGVRVTNGTVNIVNCTIAGNQGWGVLNQGGIVTLRNAIIWGNSAGGLSGCAATYTDCQNPVAGAGNLSADPRFADATYCHERSRTAHYAGGYFSGGGWEKGTDHSPCIDAGDPADAWNSEPKPAGRRINQGAYGNTPTASQTRPNTVISVH